MTDKILFRRGNSVDWAAINPTLSTGEPAVEVDTRRMKIGDGATAWDRLPYVIIDETTLVSTDVLVLSSRAPSAPQPGMVWILRTDPPPSTGGTTGPPPVTTKPAFSGSMDRISGGALTLVGTAYIPTSGSTLTPTATLAPSESLAPRG